MQKSHKPKRHGKLIKCDICKNKMDLEEERLKGNVEYTCGKEILYCPCGNEIVIK